jgi:hypothetical protein
MLGCKADLMLQTNVNEGYQGNQPSSTEHTGVDISNITAHSLHTSHLTPHTSHLTPHTSHLTPHNSQRSAYICTYILSFAASAHATRTLFASLCFCCFVHVVASQSVILTLILTLLHQVLFKVCTRP